MALVIIEREGKDAGFATTLSNLRPAGTIIDEIILLHKASELDDSKTKVSLPRLDKIDRICFEIEDIPVEISWNTGGYDNMDTSWDYGQRVLLCALLALRVPYQPVMVPCLTGLSRRCWGESLHWFRVLKSWVM